MNDPTDMKNGDDVWQVCPCCGLRQVIPPIPPDHEAHCARCSSALFGRLEKYHSNRRTVAIALAALILYPFAVSMPLLEVQQFGYRQASSILDGVATLLAGGDWFVGIIVLLCSILLPLGKLIALLALSAGGVMIPGPHKALTYRIVEWTGRWGMLDILVVALLVAVIKLGDSLNVHVGPAAWAFASVVVLSLLASASFNPHALWETTS